jgi:hypothetical protein
MALVSFFCILAGFAGGICFPWIKGRLFAQKKRSKAIPRGTAPRKRGRPKKEQAAQGEAWIRPDAPPSL